MDFRPALRHDVVFEPGGAGEPASLHDPLLGLRLNLGPDSHAIAERLDGRRTWADIAEELRPRHGSREKLDATLRRFMLLNFTEGAGAETVERLRQIQRGVASLPHTVLEGARFACQGSGECCQSYMFGPLSDEECARLDTPQVQAAFPRLDGRPAWEERSPDNGRSGRYLRTIGDRCIFLEDDCRCGLHARLGPESKPAFCQVYPIEVMATVEGLKIYDRGTCSTFAVSARSGLPILQDLPRLEALVGARHRLVHPVVHMDDKIVCDYGYFLKLQRALIQLVSRGIGTAAETLRAAARRVRELAAALAACPLADGEPDRTVDEVLARDPAPLYADPPGRGQAQEGAEVISVVAAELLEVLSATIAVAKDESTNYLGERLSREAAQLLHLVAALAAEVADPAGSPPGDFYARVAATPLADPDDVDQVLRLSMRQQFFGQRALVVDRPLPSLLRMAFVMLMAVHGARLRAVVEGRPAALSADLSYGHMLAARMLDLGVARSALLQHEDMTWQVLDGLPAALTRNAAS